MRTITVTIGFVLFGLTPALVELMAPYAFPFYAAVAVAVTGYVITITIADRAAHRRYRAVMDRHRTNH